MATSAVVLHEILFLYPRLNDQAGGRLGFIEPGGWLFLRRHRIQIVSDIVALRVLLLDSRLLYGSQLTHVNETGGKIVLSAPIGLLRVLTDNL